MSLGQIHNILIFVRHTIQGIIYSNFLIYIHSSDSWKSFVVQVCPGFYPSSWLWNKENHVELLFWQFGSRTTRFFSRLWRSVGLWAPLEIHWYVCSSPDFKTPFENGACLKLKWLIMLIQLDGARFWLRWVPFSKGSLKKTQY